MSFNDFLKTYYPDVEGVEPNHSFRDENTHFNIESILREHQSVSTKNLNIAHSEKEYTGKKCSQINVQLDSEKNSNGISQKSNKRSKASIFLRQIIYASYKASGLKENEYFNLLKKIVGKTRSKGEIESSLFEQQVLPSEFILSVDRTFNLKQKTKTFSLRHMSLHWLGEAHLDLFVRDLIKTFNGIKPTKNVFKLFESDTSDFKVILPSKHLRSFITLFYKLHKAGVIKVIGNRGLYVYLQNHLEAPENDKYPKRAFRKLRHEAEKNNTVKNNISRTIKPLLIKYCP